MSKSLWRALLAFVAFATFTPAVLSGAATGAGATESDPTPGETWISSLLGDTDKERVIADIAPTPVDFDVDALLAQAGVEPPAPAPQPADGGVRAAMTTTYEVTTKIDVVNAADGVLSLREAFDEANADGTDSVIVVPSGVEYRLTNCGVDDTNVAGDLDHTEANDLKLVSPIDSLDLELVFGGFLSGIARITTDCTERLIHTIMPGQFTVEGVALSDGDEPANLGGAIASAGPVVVRDSIVASSSAGFVGGGIFSFDDVTIERSLLLGNDGGVGGGGLVAGGSAHISQSAIGGGTSGVASWVSTGGDLTVEFSTFVFSDTTNVGTGDIVINGNFHSTASVYAVGLGPSVRCSVMGTTTSGGYNFVDDGSCGFGATGDIEQLGADPQLGGGFLGPAPGSPLHDAVPAALCDGGVDVFGTDRPQGDRCEVGGFELPLLTAPLLSAATDVLTAVVFDDVLAELDDPLGYADPSSLKVKKQPSNGTAKLVGQKLTYTPGTDAAGVDSFSLEICDTAGVDCGTIAVKITTDGLKSKWFFTNALAGGVASAELLFGKGAGDEFFVGDFNGNGIDDIVKRQHGTNLFEIRNLDGVATAANQTFSYGKKGDEVFVGDYNGNGTDTLAVRRGNKFFIKNSVTPGNADVVIGYGKAGDEVHIGDYSGNGVDTIAVRRANVFFVADSIKTGNADKVFGYGKASDEVLLGDWNRDRVDTFAVRRVKEIFIRNDFLTAPAEFSFSFGKASDQLFPGDWNNDGLDTFAVRRIVN